MPRAWIPASFGVRAAEFAAIVFFSACASASQSKVDDAPNGEEVRARLARLTLPSSLLPPADVSNKYADEPMAAVLGQKLFFETRLSGPLLDESNNGTSGTLGMKGETGKVACASCHNPTAAFLDARTPRRQISLAAGWTRRRAPSLLDVSFNTFLMWDGRRDAAHNQVFGPIESPVEFNSSRLFVAQQVSKLYRADYEALFGPMPSLDAYTALDAAQAGCTSLPADAVNGSCPQPGADDDAVTRVVVNVGKAIQAYERLLHCGPSRFDQWMAGDEAALTPLEQQGAALFVGKGACDACHSGPLFTDRAFHNLGVTPALVALFFVDRDDPGAAAGLAEAKADKLNTKGPFSDGYDGRLDSLPADLSSLLGAFRTPSLRCVGRRPTYMHTGQYRSLEDAVAFLNRGGGPSGYLGEKENYARNLSEDELAAIVAFLRALDGPGPTADLIAAPTLP
jgi:cytochrome c peroxidase